MNHTMNITGERLVEEQYRSSLGGYVIYLMHAASYHFAEKYCQGMRVLDLGCGDGALLRKAHAKTGSRA